jgi:hypothetical protein
MAAPVTAVQASIQNKASAAARRKNDVVGKSRARPLRRTEEVPGEGKGKERAICNCATSGSHGPECRWKDDDDDDDDMEGIPKHQTQPVTAGRIPHSKGPVRVKSRADDIELIRLFP